jgi:hypothetical protein
MPSEKDCVKYRKNKTNWSSHTELKQNPCGIRTCYVHNHIRLCGGVWQKIHSPPPKRKQIPSSHDSSQKKQKTIDIYFKTPKDQIEITRQKESGEPGLHTTNSTSKCEKIDFNFDSIQYSNEKLIRESSSLLQKDIPSPLICEEITSSLPPSPSLVFTIPSQSHERKRPQNEKLSHESKSNHHNHTQECTDLSVSSISSSSHRVGRPHLVKSQSHIKSHHFDVIDLT